MGHDGRYALVMGVPATVVAQHLDMEMLLALRDWRPRGFADAAPATVLPRGLQVVRVGDHTGDPDRPEDYFVGIELWMGDLRGTIASSKAITTQQLHDARLDVEMAMHGLGIVNPPKPRLVLVWADLGA